MEGMVSNFWLGKRVFITGHTGFKGAWLVKMLKMRGATVMGYALAPAVSPNLFELDNIGEGITSIISDIRDFSALKSAFDGFSPEIVFHLAAQPIVRESYKEPRMTYETNVMGTVNLFESIRLSSSVKSIVNVTTDKVYENKEWIWGYRENETLNGYDPYSNSKSCSELVTQSYINSFFHDRDIAISTCRAGNVIGGGDFSVDRIIPDCVRAALSGEPLVLRNPASIRPYQHVSEPLGAYMQIAEKQYDDAALAGAYNIGPDDKDCVSSLEIVELFAKKWGDGFEYRVERDPSAPHEANFLKLDCSKIKSVFGWKPRTDIKKAIELTVAWVRKRENLL